jgi:hypothetical protein
MPKRRKTLAQRELEILAQIREERDQELLSRVLPLRSGDKNSIEEDAERLLAASRRGKNGPVVTDEWLSREQYILRKNKEVYSASGVPDASLISGLYKRAYNPEFGNRPNKTKSSDDG